MFDRIETKMGAVLERETEGEEKRLREKIVMLKRELKDRVMVWNDPSDRNYRVCQLCNSHEYKHSKECVLA